MANIKQLRVDNSNIYPITHEDAVMDDNGVAISDKYATKESVAATLSELGEAVNQASELASYLNTILGDGNQLLTSNKDTIVAAINEAFQYGNSVKQSLVDALIAKGVTNISTSTSMSDLIYKLSQLQVGGSNTVIVPGLPSWMGNSEGGIDISNSWIQGSSFTSLHGHGAGVIGDKIYVCGGLSATSTTTSSNYRNASYYYNVKVNGWGPTDNNMTTAKYKHAYAVANNKMYALTGYSASNTKTKTNFCFDPLTETWTTKFEYPGGEMYGAAAVGINNSVYVCGGYVNAAQSTFYVYDTTQDTWTQLTNITNSVYQHAVTAYNNHIYVMGGYRTNTNYAYDINTKQWTTQTAIPENVQNHTISTLKNKIYLIGGQTGSWTNTASDLVQCFNPSSNSWEVTKTSLPTAMYNHSAAVHNNNIYIMGGRNSGTVFSTTYCYIPD